MKLKNNLKRILSGVMSFAIIASIIPCFPAFADEQTESERYPYTMFAASDSEGAITINADNVCINGSIAANGTIVSTSPNFNVNGTKTENADEEMIYIQKKLNYSYFSGDNVEMYAADYTFEDQNININNPMDIKGTLEMTGNINLNSGIKALEDVNLNGEVKNTNNSVIFSETGDININTNNTNFSGLIYAPYGDIVIDTDNLNLNNVVIIGQTITLDCPSINANFNSYIAEFVGNQNDESNKPNDSDAYIFVNGIYNAEALSVDIEWFTESEINKFDIWESYDNTEYILVDTVTDANSYKYDLTEDFETKYFKVSFTDNKNSTIESIPFSVIKTDDGYKIVLIDTDEDGLADIYEIILGTDLQVDDSDGDNLTDYHEVYVTGTDPTVYDSVTEGVSDADVDSDGDGLSNAQEIELATDPQLSDTDYDNLSDYDEIYVYGTDPLNPDTDDDGLKDGTEIKLGLDSKDPQTFGIPDVDYQVEQSIGTENDIFVAVNTENCPYTFSLDIISNGDIEENMYVDESRLLGSVKGDAILGNGIDIEISDECSPSKIVLNYIINEDYVENDLGAFSGIDKFNGIKRLAVFKYFEEINALLPIYTEYDITNNKIYASVESEGSYFVVDTEKWLDGLGITANDFIYEEAASPMLIKNQSVNILSSEVKSSTEKIGKGASGNFFKNEPIDLVFAIQNCGFGEEAKNKFEFEKQLIRDVSSYAFKNYEDVRVHLIAYNIEWNYTNAYIDGMPFFFSIEEVEAALNKIEYKTNISTANRALGHYLSFMNAGRLSYRNNSTWFIYNLTNYSTYFTDALGNYSYDYQSVYDYFWHNGMYYSQVIEGGNNFDSILGELIQNNFRSVNDQTAISFIKGKVGVDLTLDTTSKNNYNSIIENLDKHIARTSLYGAYSPLDWQKKILAGELTDEKLVDTDKDALPDWEEIDTSKLIMHSDGSFDLPTINN